MAEPSGDARLGAGRSSWLFGGVVGVAMLAPAASAQDASRPPRASSTS